MAHPIRVIDKRNKHYFVLDDVYLNGYAKHLGPIASMVYVSLCRHASKEQTAFPSQGLIATEIGIGKRTVVDKIAILKNWNLINIERARTKDGTWLRNNYILLDKTVWKELPSATTAHGQPSANHCTWVEPTNQVQPLHTKYTQCFKDTHISENLENFERKHSKRNRQLKRSFSFRNNPAKPFTTYEKKKKVYVDGREII